MQRLRHFHVWLFAIYPILFLFSHNIGLVSVSQTFVPLVLSVAFAISLRGALSLVIKNDIKVNIFVSFFMAWLFSYGYLFELMNKTNFWGIDLGQHKFAFPVWGMLVLILGILLLRTRRDLQMVTDFLNVMAIALLSISAVNAAYRVIGRITADRPTKVEVAVSSESSARKPDIYYIVLDGCARADVLRDIFQIDVTAIDQDLTKDGFFIASRSRSNYVQTQLSLASALNFTYLDRLVEQVGVESGDHLPLRKMIHHSQLVDFLKQQGYQFVAFATGVDNTEVKSADLYLTDQLSVSEFENVLLNSTPIPGLLRRLLSGSSEFQYRSHIGRILYTFDHLEDITKISAPTFAFAHIMACHPPFVFKENGEWVIPDRDFAYDDGNFFKGGPGEYIEGYGEQSLFIYSRVERAVESVLADSPEPPIIVLQGDHGAGSMLNFGSLEQTNLRERTSILNAYYLPYGGNEQLYDGITPVNTFRVILKYYFGAKLELLEDKSFYSTIDKPYKMTDVTNILDEK